MDNIFLHGKIIYPEETENFLSRKLFIQERQYLSSEEKYFPEEINFDPFSQKKSDAQVGRVYTYHILQTISKGPSNF
jgi:hypothetical protein